MSNFIEPLRLYEDLTPPNIWLVYQLDHAQLARAKRLINLDNLHHLLIRGYDLNFGGPRRIFLGQPYQTALCAILGVKVLPQPKSYKPYDDPRLHWNEDCTDYYQNRADWDTYAKESMVYVVPSRFVAQHAIFMTLRQACDRDAALAMLREKYDERLVDAVIAYQNRFYEGG